MAELRELKEVECLVQHMLNEEGSEEGRQFFMEELHKIRMEIEAIEEQSSVEDPGTE